MGLAQSGGSGGAAIPELSSSTTTPSLPIDTAPARTRAPNRPGANNLVGGNGTNNTINTFSGAPDRSPSLDAMAAIAGVVFVVVVAGAICLFNHFRRTPANNTLPVVVEQRNRAPLFEMLDTLAKPVSKKDWSSGIFNENNNPTVHTTTQDTCAICLEPVDESDGVRPLPCNHIFHQPCFDKWFWNTDYPNKCPLCRAEFIDTTQFPKAPEQSHLAP